MQRLKLESVADLLNTAELTRVTEAVELLAVALKRRAAAPAAMTAGFRPAPVTD